MPVSGDTFRTSSAFVDTTILQNYLRTGANQTWDFSKMTARSQAVRSFVSSSQTPYTIPGNRIGLLIADTLDFGGTPITNVYSFITSTTTDFSVDYRAATVPISPVGPFFPIQVPYQDKDEVFQFPLDYLDRDSSAFNFVFNNLVPPLYYAGSGVRINAVDGWGTVSTPNGTFNALKVVSDLISIDSVSATGQNFAIESHLREYQWLAIEERVPILKVSGNVFAGVFVPALVEYRDSARVITPLIPSIAIFTADTTVVDLNDTLGFTNLSIGGLGLTHEWSFNPNNVVYRSGNSASRNIEVSFTDTGFYDVQLIVSAGTSKDTLLRENYIKVLGSNGIQSVNNELLNKVFLSPNPSPLGEIMILRVENEIDLVGYEVVDVNGKTIERAKVVNKRSVRLKAPVTSGIYFYKVITRQGSIVKKIIIE